MDSKKTYQPVSCDFMDNVELSAIQNRIDTIRYYDGGEIREIEDSVENWETENGEEYLFTGSGKKIRMDKIIRLFDFQGPANQSGA